MSCNMLLSHMILVDSTIDINNATVDPTPAPVYPVFAALGPDGGGIGLVLLPRAIVGPLGVRGTVGFAVCRHH